jgi:hypothetical protein
MSEKHVEAINVLKDEVDVIAEKVKILMVMDAKLKFKAALLPTVPSAQVYRGLALRRELKTQVDRGTAILESIRTLEGDNN